MSARPDRTVHGDGGEYLKPCARCKGSRKGVQYCMAMGHTPLSEDKMEEEDAAGEEVEDDDEVEDAAEDQEKMLEPEFQKLHASEVAGRLPEPPATAVHVSPKPTVSRSKLHKRKQPQPRLTKEQRTAAGIACSICNDQHYESESKKLCAGCEIRACHQSCHSASPLSGSWYCEGCMVDRTDRNSAAAATWDEAVRKLEEMLGPKVKTFLTRPMGKSADADTIMDGHGDAAGGELGSSVAHGAGADVNGPGEGRGETRRRSEDGGDKSMRAGHEEEETCEEGESKPRKKRKGSAGSRDADGGGSASKGVARGRGAKADTPGMSNSGMALKRVIRASDRVDGKRGKKEVRNRVGELDTLLARFNEREKGEMLHDVLKVYTFSGFQTTLLHLIMQIEDGDAAEKILERLMDLKLRRLLHSGSVPRDQEGQSPLYDAVLNLKFGCVKVLIKDEPRINGKKWKYDFMNMHDSEYRMTALHHIVQHCSNEVCSNPKHTDSDMEDLIKMAELMIENGADVTKTDASGFTPLHFVVPSADRVQEMVKRSGTISPDQANKLAMLARTMIEKGAVVDARCSEQWNASALYYVLALNDDGLSPLVGALCQGGADPLLDHTNDTITDMFKDELGITLKGPESPWSLAHRNRLPECIKQLSASICRRNGTAAPEGEADTNSRLYQLQSQRGDPHEIVLPIPDGGGAGLKREDIDYLVKVLHHDVADLATVDFNQQICVQESCAQLIPEGSDVAKAKALVQAYVLKRLCFSDCSECMSYEGGRVRMGGKVLRL